MSDITLVATDKKPSNEEILRQQAIVDKNKIMANGLLEYTRCGYVWRHRKSSITLNKSCPYCQTPYWNKVSIRVFGVRTKLADRINEHRLCKCGCGKMVKRGRNYLSGHYRPTTKGLSIPSKKKGLRHERYYGEQRAREIRQKLINDRKGKTWEEIFGVEKANKLRICKSEYFKAHNPAKLNAGRTFEERFGKERADEIKRHFSEATKKGISHTNPKRRATMLKKWEEDDEYVMKVIDGWEKRPNKCEMTIDRLANEVVPGIFGYNGDGRLHIKIGHHIPDFVNLTSKKQVIEYFGEHWHDIESEFLPTIEDYKKHGYDCLIIKDGEIYKGEERIGVLKHKIKQFAESDGFIIINGRYYFNCPDNKYYKLFQGAN